MASSSPSSSSAASGAVVFAVNGERVELRGGDVDPGATLLEFLRTRTRFTGPKLGCGEGGCGACVVLLSTYDAASGAVSHAAASSCLTLVHGLHHRAVTTTEGLGSSGRVRGGGLHAVHARLAGFHASQCGFCTPGVCMSLAAALAAAESAAGRPEPPEGFSRLTAAEAERAVAGNLCRCTGYRPIADACKSFAADVDLEDLGLNSFWRKGDADASKLPRYNEGSIGAFPEFLKAEIRVSLGIDGCTPAALVRSESSWHRPRSVDEYYKLVGSELFGESRTKVVVGNTASGVYREAGVYDRYIDLRDIPELNSVNKDARGVEIGAAVSISRVIEILRGEGGGCKDVVSGKIADHMEKVASPFIRNTASLGGNLIMAQRDQFASDIATILLAAGSSICMQVSSERLAVTLEEFLEMPPCDYKTLLLSIHIPHWTPTGVLSGDRTLNRTGSTRGTYVLFETCRAAPRPLGNAVAYLNSAFSAQAALDETSGILILDKLCLAFGAYGTQHAIRAKNVEKFLVGKPITASVLLEACKVLKNTIVPKEGTRHAAYRSSLAVSFLFSFLYPVTRGTLKPVKAVHFNGCVTSGSNGNPNCEPDTHVDASLMEINSVKSSLYSNDRILESSKQIIEINKDYLPVGIPAKKVGAELQASGEAVFVDDIPSPKDCLYGAFIYSTKPLAHVKGIELDPSLKQLKTVAVVTVNDIPEGGSNVGANTVFGPEPLFGDPITQCAGEPLGVVIAETQRLANIAAKRAVINYSTENLDTPVLSIEEAVKRCSYFETLPFLLPQKIGDFSKGMAEADQKIYSAEVKLNSQYYFYMETQTALAIPDEDNCMVVYSSSQCPETAQNVIAKCLGIPCHNVRVITRRVGGGFGGKAVRSLPVATACALAAFKLHRPIRMYLERKTDIIMTGGRHPMKICYSVGFKSDGKITALHIDLFINAGMTKDVSPIIPHNFIEALKKYNWGAFSYDAKVCKTNISTKSAMRGPGEVQGSYVAEAIIEHVASALSTDANLVRQRNLHTVESLALFHSECAEDAIGYTLPSICDQLTASENYQHRLEMVQSFNGNNKWKKRGLSFVPIVHKVLSRPTPGKVSIFNDGSIAVEVGGIELGQGLWTKVKQMAAFGLGQLWADKSQDLFERIRVIQADTLSVVQGGWTTGSTTSESSCEAVRCACNILVDRLKPVKEQFEEKQGNISWDELISKAIMVGVDLSAREYYVPGPSGSYLNYGAAASEVEIDLLTGATTILRSDLLYDCGQSLNPAVDLGQVEGAFVQGIGYFMSEEYVTNSNGLVVSDGTWTYKIPTVDTIPKQFNVELFNSGFHKKRVLSSKASGEPPLLLAASVHCATREAIRAARKELHCSVSGSSPSHFDLKVPAIMPVVKELCGLDNVERYLESLLSSK
ncbi:indole-3-acetaldehyde oxidase-like [Phragmites australis]|uniref:indole-3-acetaldehyde oxidase-like n=1 Tax=Phragmites australis TaxID=29695 RepID=UPI002D778E8E|nr:indole-3-acetaldehyde oxidase-like [Phragmites australis]